MSEVSFSNVSQVLRRTVKVDGRCGGLQNFAGRAVDIVVYNDIETTCDANADGEN